MIAGQPERALKCN